MCVSWVFLTSPSHHGSSHSWSDTRLLRHAHWYYMVCRRNSGYQLRNLSRSAYKTESAARGVWNAWKEIHDFVFRWYSHMWYCSLPLLIFWHWFSLSVLLWSNLKVWSWSTWSCNLWTIPSYIFMFILMIHNAEWLQGLKITWSIYRVENQFVCALRYDKFCVFLCVACKGPYYYYFYSLWFGETLRISHFLLHFLLWQVAAMTSLAKQHRKILDKRVSKIAGYGISV